MESLTEIVEGLDRVVDELSDLQPTAHEPSTLSRLDACRRRAAVLLLAH